VASGLATAAAGAAAAAAVSAAWWCCNAGAASAREMCCSSFVVSSRSQVFGWLKVWLAAQPEFARSGQPTAVQLAQELDPGLQLEGPGAQGELGFSAAQESTHWLRYAGTLASLALRRERVPGAQDVETLELTLHGWPGPGAAAHRRAQMVALVGEARRLYAGQTRGRTELFIGQGEYGQWDSIGTRRSRTLGSVVLPAGLAEDVMADARRFKAGASWYVDRGIPYRRGYLLHGTPGSGKTSLISAMAGELELNICILNLSNPSLDDGKLLELMAEVPADSIVVLEDVDAAFQQRDRASDGAAGGITFSGLLNAIDGVAAQEGRLLCLTTNHAERLDPALIRPGRIDTRVEFGHAQPDQVNRLFRQFYKAEGQAADATLARQADRFAALLVGSGRQYSMAAVQGHLLLHTADPAAALECTPTPA
jgi:chaperone BCS1